MLFDSAAAHRRWLEAQSALPGGFRVGTTAVDLPVEKHAELADQMALMLRMIIVGTQTLSKRPELAGGSAPAKAP